MSEREKIQYKRIIATTQGERLMTYMHWGEGFVVRPVRSASKQPLPEGFAEYVIECCYSYDKWLVDKLVAIFDGK